MAVVVLAVDGLCRWGSSAGSTVAAEKLEAGSSGPQTKVLYI